MPSRRVHIIWAVLLIWLGVGTPGAQEAGELLMSSRSLDDLADAGVESISVIPDSERQIAETRTVAAAFRAANRLESAAHYYERAYEISGGNDLDSLFSRARILLELGQTERAATLAREVVTRTSDFSLKRRAYTLLAQSSFEAGESEAALEMLGTLASLADEGERARELVEVESLVLLRRIQLSLGDPAAARTTERVLRDLFPESIAVGIIENERRIQSAALPSVLLFGGEPIEATVAETSVADAAPSAQRRDQPMLSAVQVGSFSDPDNALHLTEDLLELGLSASYEEISREGRSLYQVIVAIPDGSTESAGRVLSTLTENGFDGFLVY